MKMKWFFFLSAILSITVRAAAPAVNWRYQLLEGSFLRDDCLICGRPSFDIPMRGSFMLRLTNANTLATSYAIENASFQAGTDYTFTGGGSYITSGDFVIHQTMTLTGDLKTPSGTIKASFTNDNG